MSFSLGQVGIPRLHNKWFHVYVENGVFQFSIVEARTKISEILLWLNNNLSNPGVSTSHATLCATLDSWLQKTKSVAKVRGRREFTQPKHPLRVGWRNFFSAVLEKFLQPINAPWVYGT
jgi:hypothetical protein